MSKQLKLFDYINMISQSKKMPEFDEHFEKNYQPFMVNRFFSLCQDNSILVANIVNKNYKMSKRDHFLFLHGTVKSAKRYNKWPKKMKEDRISFIQDVFEYSYDKAKVANNILSDEQLDLLREHLDTGGKV